MKKLLFIAAICLPAVTVTGCGTVAGAGEDVSHVGHTITDSADDNR